jgi:DNA-binding MarR family transcriptional regulator
VQKLRLMNYSIHVASRVVRAALPRAELQAQLGEVLGRLLKALRTQLPLEVSGQGRVTPDQFAVLAHLNDSGGCTMGELAAARGIALNSATALVDRLVQTGLVQRAQPPQDRRIVRVALTPAGTHLVAGLRKVRAAAFRRLIGSLGEAELEAIAAALPALDRLTRLAAESGRRP